MKILTNASLPLRLASLIATGSLLLCASLSFAGSSAENPSTEKSSAAEPSATHTMAKILIELNHLPSAEQKEILTAIANAQASSNTVKTLATAIRNIEHKALPQDVAALEQLSKSSQVSPAEQQLATIIMNINHTASAQQKEQLQALAN